jgi:hypothetical protein
MLLLKLPIKIICMEVEGVTSTVVHLEAWRTKSSQIPLLEGTIRKNLISQGLKRRQLITVLLIGPKALGF